MLETSMHDYLFQEILDKLDVNLIVVSKDNKAVPKETYEFIKHCLMVGIFVNDMGGLKKLLEKENNLLASHTEE